MAHVNARLNWHGRVLLVRRVCFDQRPTSHAARELGVSRQCASRWVARFRAEGWDGLYDRSSRPHASPTRTSSEREAAVVTARGVHRCGPARLAVLTGVPERTVSRVLRRHHVAYLSACDPLTGAVIRSSKSTAIRDERAAPGELIHMDVQKLGRIPDGGGWKAHGRAAGSTGLRKRSKVGFDYVHSAVDDHSRLAYSEVLPDEQGLTCAGFLTRAAAWFHQAGITRIERVMTDNHWSYAKSGDVARVMTELGARHVFIRPHCPWQNGKS